MPVSQIGALLGVTSLANASEYGISANAGHETSQSDSAKRADLARSGSGVDGTCIQVGVISDSFDTSGSHYPAVLGGGLDTMTYDILSGDLPNDTAILQDFVGGHDEGRGMAQLIHDLAPGAGIRFATGEFGQANFANNIIALANAGSK